MLVWQKKNCSWSWNAGASRCHQWMAFLLLHELDCTFKNKKQGHNMTCAFLFHIVWLTQLLIVNWACLTHWLVELFTKNAFLDILDNFSLEMGQISSHLLKKGFAIWQHNFLSTSSTFYDSFAWACAEIKILRKWPTSLGFSFFFLFLAVIECLLDLLPV